MYPLPTSWPVVTSSEMTMEYHRQDSDLDMVKMPSVTITSMTAITHVVLLATSISFLPPGMWFRKRLKRYLGPWESNEMGCGGQSHPLPSFAAVLLSSAVFCSLRSHVLYMDGSYWDNFWCGFQVLSFSLVCVQSRNPLFLCLHLSCWEKTSLLDPRSLGEAITTDTV